ncbi:MAG: hypothetical protein IJW22_02450 [Clostridia bacterium]|nr:hypothetical protein [Clostridia bacterium]
MAEDKKKVEGKYLMYQGKPLVREEDTVIYGDLNNDPCVLVLEIMSYKGEGDEKTPDTVMIQILDSKDPNNIIKQGKKQGMHDAFDLGLTWLDLELKKSSAE